MKNNNQMNLSISMNPHAIPLFYSLLERGFYVEAKTGCSIRSFLAESLNLSNDYIDNQLQTVFLDGDTCDDLDQSSVVDGSVLALSAAMPGLVGATLRKGGPLAVMRKEITASKNLVCQSQENGLIKVKLFNLVRKKLGSQCLENGILIDGEKIEDLLRAFQSDIEKHIRYVFRDGDPISEEQLFEITFANKLVLLKIVPMS